MEDTVPQDEKMRRLHAVEALQERVGSEINARLVGTVQEVLMEGEKDGVLTGRNRGNKLVHFREQGTGNKEHAGPIPGYLVNVTITRATAWSLQGGLLNPGESLKDAAVRKLDDETGLTDVFLEQLYTFSDLDGQGAVAVAYFALVDVSATHLARRREWLPAWFPVRQLPELAFRNEDVIDYALRRQIGRA